MEVSNIKKKRVTAQFPTNEHPFNYPLLGLTNKADDVAESNLAKLLDRQSRGKIRGDGDNR